VVYEVTEQTLYKLTDDQGQTHGDGTKNIQWGAGITHKAAGPANGPLCSASWIHAYEHPLLAALLNPIHADFKSPQLWSASGVVGKRDGQLKCGCRQLTTVEQIELPKILIEQRVRFAIGCAWARASHKWQSWAQDWLDGKDRSAEAARAAGWAARAAAEAARAAARAAAEAAWAAAEAAWAAGWAAEAAEAAEAAWAAGWAAEAAAGAADLDLIRIAEWAISDLPITALYPATKVI
jgi:hypothetical protein